MMQSPSRPSTVRVKTRRKDEDDRDHSERPLELCADKKPSLFFGKQPESNATDTMDKATNSSLIRNLDDAFHPTFVLPVDDSKSVLSSDEDTSSDADWLSTSAQPGIDIENEGIMAAPVTRTPRSPTASFIHSEALSTTDDSASFGSDEPATLKSPSSYSSPVRSCRHSIDDTLEDTLQISNALHSPASSRTRTSSTETTVTASTHMYYYTEDDSMSWEDWNKTVEAQLSPWCDLLTASQEEEADLLMLVQTQFQEDFQCQNEIQRAIASAFLQGITLQQQRHAAKLKELEEQHKHQIRMLQQTSDSVQPREHPTSLRFQYGPKRRSQGLRRRWTKASSSASVVTEGLDFDNHTVMSVLSTMSCRELSIERYQRSKRVPDLSNQNSAGEEKQPKKNEEIRRLLSELQEAERRQKRLEQQLQQAGVVLAEDIPYHEAKDHVDRIAKRMNEIGSCEAQHEDPLVQKALQAEYFRLEQDMEKYMQALLLTDEYIAEQQQAEDAWEEANEEDNKLALQQLRSYMPVDVRKLDRQQMLDLNIPPAMVKKFQRTNVLQLLRRDPIKSIARWHPSNLESLRISGLTLTERRALHHHLLPAARRWADRNDPLAERKRTWFQMMRANFKEALAKYHRHVEESDDQTGSSHQCSLIGRQCPIRADRMMDYTKKGLGFPVEDVYEESLEAPTAQAAADKYDDHALYDQRSQERLQELRGHYKGSPIKVREVAEAMSACEDMVVLMDQMDLQQEEWIIQQLQTSPPGATRNRDFAKIDQLLSELKRSLSSWSLRTQTRGGDKRSFTEVGLLEELYETASNYIAEVNRHLLAVPPEESRRLQSTIDQVEPLLELNHTSNLLVLSQATEKPIKTRKRKSRTEIMAALWKKDCNASVASTTDCKHGRYPGAEKATKTSQNRLSDSLTEEIKKKTKQKPVSNRKPPMGLLEAIAARRGER